MCGVDLRIVTPDEIIHTVHEIDRLEEQKRQRTADLDAKIAVLKEQIAHATATAVGESKSTSRIPSAHKSLVKGSLRLAPMGKASPRKQLVIEHISAHPMANYDSLVSAIYGEVNKRTNDAAHSLIFDMKKRGVIVGDSGSWRVVNAALAAATAAGGARKNGINPR